MTRKKSAKQNTCKVCGKGFSTSQAASQHRQAAHAAGQQSQPRKRQPLQQPNPYGVALMPMAPTSVARAKMPYRLDNLGATLAGSEWARRALHPCDETRSGGIKIPDSSELRTAAVEDRHIVVINDADSSTSVKNWDCEFGILPFPDVPVVYRTRDSGTDAWSYWHPLSSTNQSFAPGQMAVPTGGTMELVLPAPPNPRKDTVPRLRTLPKLVTNITGFRTAFKGVTIELDASALSDMGTVVAGQWPQALSTVQRVAYLRNAIVPEGLTQEQYALINQEISHFVIEDFPDNADAVLQKCPGALYDRAKYGVYMPLGFVNPTHKLQEPIGSEFANIELDGPGKTNQAMKCGGIIQLLDPVADGQSPIVSGGDIVWTISPYRIPSTTTDLGNATTTVGPNNMMTGVILFQGISKEANLMIKFRQGLEIAPTSLSALHAAISDSAPMDEQAIKMVQLVNREVPLALPAKYNNLGLLLPMIGKIASAVAPMVYPWLMRGVGKMFGGQGVPNV